MAKKVKIGIKVPTSSELNRRYGNLLINPSTQERPKLWLPSRFLALNYQYGGGIPFGKILEVMGQESSGKAVPLDSPILTSTGYKLMGELSLSDKVMDPVSGDPIPIIGIYPQGLKRVYKVTFRDGTSAECSEDHLWEVQFRSHHQYKSQVLTIKEILEKGYRTKGASGKGKFKYKYNIPSTIPLNFEKKELPIHPYILGYILGDGGLGRANYIMFNIGLEDADSFKHNISKFLKEGAELEDKGIYENPFGKTHRFILKGYSKEIRSLCLEGKLSSDKFIPEDYLWSSVEDRKYLLAGLLDSDGTIGEQHNRARYSSRFKFSSTSSKMIKQLVQIVRSLGGFITEPKPKTRERQFEGYEKRVSREIRTGGRLPFNPFMLERKRKQYQVKIENQTKSANYRRSIIDISYVGKKECQCIKVSSERGLFMLNDFIVTHNTLVAYDFAYCTQQLGGHVIWVDAEQSWDNSWAGQNGIELDKVTIISSTEIETISDAIADLSILWRSKLTHNEPILLVVDSIAAMDCTENINIKMTDGKAEMGGRAKALYKMFRIRTELLSKLGITQIYINQLRVALNVGFGQDNTTSTGGKALGFYASIRSAFYAGKQVTKKVKGKERKVGKLVSIRPIKNKVSPLRNTISKAPIYFNPKYVEYVGFDRYHGFADILVEEDVLEKTSGGIYKYKGKTVARGEEKFQSVVEEDDKLRRKLIRACGINTISVTQNKIDELVEKGINLFPVDGNLDYESQSDDLEDEEGEEEFED
jgi:RecA/RadA recombinase